MWSQQTSDSSVTKHCDFTLIIAFKCQVHEKKKYTKNLPLINSQPDLTCWLVLVLNFFHLVMIANFITIFFHLTLWTGSVCYYFFSSFSLSIEPNDPSVDILLSIRNDKKTTVENTKIEYRTVDNFYTIVVYFFFVFLCFFSRIFIVFVFGINASSVCCYSAAHLLSFYLAQYSYSYGILFWELKTVRSLGWRDFNWRMVCTIESSWADQPTGYVCIYDLVGGNCVWVNTCVAIHAPCMYVFIFQWKWRVTLLAIDWLRQTLTWRHDLIHFGSWWILLDK